MALAFNHWLSKWEVLAYQDSMVSGTVSIPRILWMRAGFSPVVKNSIRAVLSVILLWTAAVWNSEMYSLTEPL